MNKVLLIGRLTRDVELQEIGNDNKIGKFGLAVNRRFKKEGQEVDFFDVIAWNKTAELCSKYLTNGSQVGISGRIEIDKWQDKEGNNRYKTNIIGEEIEFLGSKSDQDTPTTKKESKTKESTDDLPF